jgi:hypothetical protein
MAAAISPQGSLADCHPLLGPDHVAAMVAVGLWGDARTPALWLLPVAFPLVMAFGGCSGSRECRFPVEIGIAVSAIRSAYGAFAVRAPLALALVLVAAFAIFHGHAHGAELPPGLTPSPFRLVSSLRPAFCISAASASGDDILAGRASRGTPHRCGDRHRRSGLSPGRVMTGLFSGVVQALSPAHLVALIALALLAGPAAVRERSAVVAAFAAGLAAGLGALVAGVGETPAGDVLLVVAALSGLAAAALRLPSSSWRLAFVVSFAGGHIPAGRDIVAEAVPSLIARPARIRALAIMTAASAARLASARCAGGRVMDDAIAGGPGAGAALGVIVCAPREGDAPFFQKPGASLRPFCSAVEQQ